MAKNEYRLIIDVGGGDSPIAYSEKDEKEAPTTKQKIGAGIYTAYTILDPFVKKAQNIMMENVQTQYANTELSQRIQLGMDVVNKVTQVGANLIGGATLASALGLGTKLGLGVGLIFSGASMALDYLTSVNRINNQRIVENESLQVLRGRAGIQVNRSRSGE